MWAEKALIKLTEHVGSSRIALNEYSLAYSVKLEHHRRGVFSSRAG